MAQENKSRAQRALWTDPEHRARLLAAFERGGSRKGTVRTPEQRARIAEGCRLSWASRRRKAYALSPEGLASGRQLRAAARLRRAAERARKNSTEE